MPDNPLVISIASGSSEVTVTNNRHPKISRTNSTGLGLNYIRQQYCDLSSRTVTVEQTPESFTVKIPLL